MKMTIENPFEGMAYVTEKGIKPEKVLERYSIIPLKYSMTFLNNRINHFCVGRTGVGKTMVLSLFDASYQKVLYSEMADGQSLGEREEILELIPKEVIGVYSNIDSPHIRITQFQGNILKKEEWLKVFGDYYGHILAKKLIYTFETLSPIIKWRERNKIQEPDENILNLIAKDYAKKICDELPDSKNISTWYELKEYIDNRISTWVREISRLGAKEFTGPTDTVQLINPILYLMEELKDKKIIKKDCRLFVVVDQYETLYEHRKNNDFRYVFNLAMRQAVRGQTGIEFKIGVRPYGYKDNLYLFESDIKLDSEKEYNELSVEMEPKVYENFIKDLTIKCLQKNEDFAQYASKGKVRYLFEELSPVQEVKKYVSNSTEKEKHFSYFFKSENTRLEREKVISSIKTLTLNIKPLEYKIYIQTLLSIQAERYLIHKETIDWVAFESFLKQRLEGLQRNLEREFGCNEAESQSDLSKESKNKEYYKYKDIKSGALFIVAASYKNVPKIYSGYNTLVKASSGVVLHYVEIVSYAFSLYLLTNVNKAEPLPAKMQSDALYKRSNKFYETITDKASHGNEVSKFLKNLGLFFRSLQLDPPLNKPYPNGLTVKDNILEELEINKSGVLELEIINEILSYGFLECEKHNDKNVLRGKRYKYYLNRLLCPYFGISITHIKDPVYIYQQNDFLKKLLQDNLKPNELKIYLSKKIEKEDISQKELFDF